MNRLLLSLLLASSLCSGCLFSKKNAKPKESSAIASDVEATFRQRWVDRRMAELQAQGRPADAARTQAEAEFREQYNFGHPARK